MLPLPPLSTAHALFLDFDGTLADLAPRPQEVCVDSALVPLLARMHTHLAGALAIVTGRPEADIDGFLGCLRLPLASEHGARYRLAQGSHAVLAAPDLAPVLDAANALAARHAGLLVEHKSASLALHYRLLPHLQALCHDTLAQALLLCTPGLELQGGKGIIEAKPRGVHKGRAISDFMAQPPFAGRVPVFVGDDVGDEPGFAAVQALGGLTIKVGAGDSLAQHRCATPAALRAWLAAACNAWQLCADRGEAGDGSDHNGHHGARSAGAASAAAVGIADAPARATTEPPR